MPATQPINWTEARKRRVISAFVDTKLSVHAISLSHGCGKQKIRDILNEAGVEINGQQTERGKASFG